MEDFTINDLCIGNKVIYGSENYDVWGIDLLTKSVLLVQQSSLGGINAVAANISFDDIQPIPITERILMKNEWYLATTETLNNGEILMRSFHHDGFRFFISFYQNDFIVIGTSKSNINFRQIKYVHEIENTLYHTANIQAKLMV